jgi:diamine N-acetyltransferase
MTKPLLWLHGDIAALGPIRADLVPEYWRWENDPGTILGYGTQVPESIESRTDGFASQTRHSQDQARFTIYDIRPEEPQPVGLASLLIDHQVRTAEYIIVLAPEARGDGIGTQATHLTLDYAFHLTGLAMVWLKVLEPNTAGIHAYQKAGFKPAGRLRNAGYWLGQRVDELIMDATCEEFPGPSVVHRPDDQ